MLKKTFYLFVFFYSISNCHSQTFTLNETDTYCNPRLSYSIKYPKNILYPQNESANGDGLKLMSTDAKAILLVYGSHNSLDESLLDRFLEESAGGTDRNLKKVVTYKVISSNWFAVSGYDSGNIFYTKTFFINEQFKTFHFTYPESQRKLYESVTKILSKSFNGNVKVSSREIDKAVVLKCL